MANAAVSRAASPVSAADPKPRHTALVRVTHWIVALSFLALLVSGVELVISHPRFYWGETGNVNTPALFQLPVPASRAGVKTGYGFVLPDQNGWSRDLHFQAAWLVVITGAVYVLYGLWTGHFRRRLLPRGADLGWRSLRSLLSAHLRLRVGEAGPGSYNALQRLTYLSVIFILFPFMIWTGLAMSPAITAAFPWAVTLLGGHQSARTLHFLGFALLSGFLVVHVVMVWRAGWSTRMGAMLTGKADAEKEQV